MRKRDLERHLRDHGCRLERQGAGHEIWLNPANEQETTLPRHRDIKPGTVRSICRRLEIPPPPKIT